MLLCRSKLNCLLVFLFTTLCHAAVAQSFLVVEQERLFDESLFGKEIQTLEAGLRQRLIEEGSKLDQEFEAEERRLTELRATTDPAAFRELADAFDAKVIATRREQEQKAVDLNSANEDRRRQFLTRVGPILLAILEETDASAVVEYRSLLVAKQDLNITDEVIKRLDDAFMTEARGNVPDGSDNNEN